jgi:GTPase Era involved in 16S rRNA processing
VILEKYLEPLNHRARELREANRLQTEQVLRDQREAQSRIVIGATDPEVREIAQREIERINALLRKT